MLCNLIKPYGVLSLPEDKINIILYLFPILNGLLRAFWGYMCDLLGFKKVYFTMLVLTVSKLSYNINYL
jgi:hypothetical protein